MEGRRFDPLGFGFRILDELTEARGTVALRPTRKSPTRRVGKCIPARIRLRNEPGYFLCIEL